jgi:predicted restriction endonuclease
VTNYTTLDFIKTRIPDCLVKYNKIGGGSGEARLYVGGAAIKNWSEFFGDFKLKCFFDKKGLTDYLEYAAFEYENPSQGYRRDITGSWQKYYQELVSFSEIIYFNVFLNNDTNNKSNNSRVYIKSSDDIWDYFRRIALPNMTSILIQKILVNNEPQLWFRLYLNDIGNELDQQIACERIAQIENDETISPTEKESIIKSRIGQGRYRDLIIEKYKRCVITGIDDERVLIASHIKPWISSSNSERVNRENGLLLSPTYDKLFDKGFISFRDTGTIMLSNHFSDSNFRRAGLSSGKKYDLQITEEMKTFLAFHRDTIFIK